MRVLAASLVLLGFSFEPAIASKPKSEPGKDGVTELTSKTFDAAIRSNKHILVNFFAPWCGHCKQLEPEYAAAAAAFPAGIGSGIAVAFAKVDSVAEPRIAEKNGVKEYPTLLLFTEGKSEEYLGTRVSSSLVRWVTKRAGTSLTRLGGDAPAVSAFLQDRNMTCLAFLEEGAKETLKVLEAASLLFDDVDFAVSTSKEAATKSGASFPSIRMHTPHEERVFSFEGKLNSAEEISAFVKDLRYPRVVPFDGDVSAELFGDGRPVLFLFRRNDDRGAAAVEALHKVSTRLRPTMLMSTVQDLTSEDYDGRLMEFIGVRSEMMPIAVLAVDPMGAISKFKQRGEVSEESLLELAHAFETKESLEPFVKSEPVPTDGGGEAGMVRSLVGLTMKDAVTDPAKHVIVLMFAPWCGHCKRLEPVWKDLAGRFASESSVVVARIDATANDLHQTEIETFPTIKLWPAGEAKKGKPVEHGEDIEKDLPNLVKWIVEHTGVSAPSLPVVEHGDDNEL